jgi:hypothetical protein
VLLTKIGVLAVINERGESYFWTEAIAVYGCRCWLGIRAINCRWGVEKVPAKKESLGVE